MTKDEQPKIGDAPIAASGWPEPSEDPLLYLKALFRFAAERGEAGLYVAAAFEGLTALVAAEEARHGDEIPVLTDHNISIPWPVAKAIALGWFRYDPRLKHGRSLGTAMGIEPKGQGRHPLLSEMLTHDQDIRIAAEVALRTSRGMKVGQAIRSVAETFRLGEEKVKSAHRRLGKGPKGRVQAS
jgi:hypothetical protein